IKDLKFNISPLSFYQVNPIQTEVLYDTALNFANLTGNEIVFDAYCGIGTISLFLAKKSKKVYGIEIVPQAIENAKKNALENNIENVEFFTGKSEEIIPKLVFEKNIIPDVMVVDPPRKGCDTALLECIIKTNIKKLVYVSCDSATLARDLKYLSENGYNLEMVQPVDMFCMSSHIETVALITRA
ncbi:MAG: 23S rRNA (uracil(1939)-C(5))-methyltransferase RlmD, partial [Eubacteriales bacterium]|nr:23S rRNA (uracil(1939)-C(5))-methyltransferase RlmD [Eubacteriales bacterium]